MPSLWPEAPPLLRWGVLFWYASIGAFIGLAGVFDHHPIFGFRITWWIRGPLVGAWMNFVLVFFSYDLMAEALLAIFGSPWSPFWFVAEGALVGALIGGLATLWGGEGAKTATHIES